MSGIKNAGIVISVFLILVGVISMLIPKGNTEKSMKLVVSLSLVSVILSTIFGTEFDLVIKFDKNDIEYTENYNENEKILSLSEDILEEELLSLLNKKSLSVEKIKVSMDISKTNSIVINSVIFSATENAEASKIKDEIYNYTECENIYEEDL